MQPLGQKSFLKNLSFFGGIFHAVERYWQYQTDMSESIPIVGRKISDPECGDIGVLIFRNQQQNSLISFF